MCRRLACRLPRSRHDRQGHSQRPLVERSRCRGVVDTGHGVKATG
jgi:hypothetical protein